MTFKEFLKVRVQSNKETEEPGCREKLRVFVLNCSRFLSKPVPKSDLVF